jgi:hypothetical protein
VASEAEGVTEWWLVFAISAFQWLQEKFLGVNMMK